MCAQIPCNAEQSQATKKGGWGLSRHFLGRCVPVQDPEMSQNSLFEPDLLGCYETLGVTVRVLQFTLLSSSPA